MTVPYLGDSAIEFELTRGIVEWNLEIFLSPDFCLLGMFAYSWVLAVVPALEDHLQDFLPLSRNTSCHLMIYLFVLRKYFLSGSKGCNLFSFARVSILREKYFSFLSCLFLLFY